MGARALILAATAAVALGASVAVSGAFSGREGAALAPVTVRMGEYYFKPKLVRVRVGQSVRFVNAGKISHTVADSDRQGHIRSRLIHPRELKHGQSQTVRFTKAGTVYYLCTFHPALMKGRIVVVR